MPKRFDVKNEYGLKIGEIREVRDYEGEAAEAIGKGVGYAIWAIPFPIVSVYVLAIRRYPLPTLAATIIAAVLGWYVWQHAQYVESGAYKADQLDPGQAVVLTQGAELRAGAPWSGRGRVIGKFDAGSEFTIVGEAELELDSNGHVLSAWWPVTSETGQSGELNGAYLRPAEGYDSENPIGLSKDTPIGQEVAIHLNPSCPPGPIRDWGKMKEDQRLEIVGPISNHFGDGVLYWEVSMKGKSGTSFIKDACLKPIDH